MTDTSAYKSRLSEELTDLEQELSSVAQPNPSNPGEWEAIQTETTPESDPNDQASALDEYQENRAIVDVLNTKHHEILAALERIEAGSYGTCEVDGAEIEPARLDADPTARTCVAHMQ